MPVGGESNTIAHMSRPGYDHAALSSMNSARLMCPKYPSRVSRLNLLVSIHASTPSAVMLAAPPPLVPQIPAESTRRGVNDMETPRSNINSRSKRYR